MKFFESADLLHEWLDEINEPAGEDYYAEFFSCQSLGQKLIRSKQLIVKD